MSEQAEPRQRVVRVTGSRRARLTAVEGTDSSPDVVTHTAPRPETVTGSGPNDERMLREVPPHY
ncbi:hypothetical protein [uncultured Microbacterium sp.]|uniref:hypothetical protein n=1 Tax=uncultured Microbacterium sp. TaxID=191216 RepID=UPI0026366C07|nr:hypothetical protein [uncultured Microbacterium sp.]